MTDRMKSKIRQPTGIQLCAEEYFGVSDISATNSISLGQVPSRELDLVEIYSSATDGWVEVYRNSANGGYVLSGGGDYNDRYLTFGSDISFSGLTDTNLIHISYRTKGLTVNTELSLTTGDVVFNVDASYSDIGDTTKKGLVDSGRYQLTSLSKVSGFVQTPDDWTDDFRAMTISLGSIDAKLPFVQANLTSISGAILTADDWTNDFRQTTVSLGAINTNIINYRGIQIPTTTTAIGNFKVSIEEAPAHIQTDVNITSVSGTTQTASDWTVTFNTIQNNTELCYTKLQNVSGSVGGISHSLGNIDLDLDITNAKLQNISGSVGGTSLSLGSIDGKIVICDTANVLGQVNINNTGLTLTTGVAHIGEVSVNNIGITLATGDNIAGQMKITDGTTVAGVDATTTAILVKEVTGAGEIANVNITSISGTIQTASDWSANLNEIESNTDRIIICNTTAVSGQVNINNTGLTLATGTNQIGLVSGSDVNATIRNAGLTISSGDITVDGQVNINNAGLTLATGVNQIGLVSGSDINATIRNVGLTISSGDITVSGQVNINNAGLTLATGTNQIGLVSGSDINATIRNTGLTISSGSVGVTANVYPANATSWTTGQVTISSYGGTQFPSVAVFPGCEIAIKAKKGNVGTICLGDTQAKSVSTSIGNIRVHCNETVLLRISNLNLVYGDTTVLNEGIEYLAETSA